MINYDGITQFNMIFTTWFQVFANVASLINTIIAVLIARKFMQIMQTSGYVNSAYKKWTYRKDNIYVKRLFMMVMLSLMAYLLFSVGFSYTEMQWNAFVGFIFYLFFAAIYIHFDFKRKNKARLVLTARTIRLIITFVVFYYIFTLAVIYAMHMIGYCFRFNKYFLDVRFGVLCLTPILIPIIVQFATLINKPFEDANNRKYIEKCKKTLAESNLIKIGITGSYGKTSVKEILRTILSVKYNVLSTPASYNTPMGICKSVRRYDGSQEIFIAEMGARKVGDIKELTDIVNPDYAILTGVGNQHLETFGTAEAVMNTKYELIRGLKEGGTAVFLADNENTYKLSERAKHDNINVVAAGVDRERCTKLYCEDIVTDISGSTFTLCAGEKKTGVKTVLIGRHNISNIMVAASLCYELNMSLEEIAQGISLIKPIRHRLEVTKNKNGMTIIDDSYNSNIEGTIAALDVFSKFKGRKIIITPGLVELGRFEDLENFRFGRRIAKVVDFAIIVGGANAYKIRDGLLDGEFPYEKIKIVPSLSDGIKFLSEITEEGDIVLFENDLPDKFM